MSAMSKEPASPWVDLDERLVTRSLPDGSPPGQAGDRPIRLGRRSLLQALGVSGVVALSACERVAPGKAVPYLEAPEGVIPGRSLRYATSCGGCTAACGMLATVRDGRPIKLEGQPGHAVSQGGLCAVGQASVRALYDAGRLRAPTLQGQASTWAEVDAFVASRLAQAKGATVVLAPTLVSPTERFAVREFLAAHGGKLVEYDAGVDGSAAVLSAYEALDGQASYPAPLLGDCDLLVVLGADPLGAGAEPVAFTAQYAARRRARVTRDFRHLQLESSLSLTGAAADERWLATPAERAAFALALLAAVAEALPSPHGGDARDWLARQNAPAPSGELAERARVVGAELVAAAGRALVVSGAADIGEQLAVALCNRLLGAEGVTLDVADGSRARRGTASELAAFLAELAAGRVKALFVLGQNPVEELPAAVTAERIAALPLAVALSERPHATALACHVVAAAHHALERWGDASPRADVLSLVQPAVEPLFETRDPAESFLRWAGAKGTGYREYLRNSWQKRVFDGATGPAFDDAFDGALAAGALPPTLARQALGRFEADSVQAFGPPPVPAPVAAAQWPAVSPPAAGQLMVEVIAEVGLRDGKSSFNPWLRELPEPLTRTSWTATARLAPATATQLGVVDGTAVQITVGEITLELVARVQPGQHSAVVAVPLGYGLKDGDGGEAARNAYRVAQMTASGLAGSGLVAKVDSRHTVAPLPLIQIESSSHDRPIIYQVSDVHEHAREEEGEHGTLLRTREYSPEWHLVVDLDSCTGCGACVVACQAENNLAVVGPEEMTNNRDMYWLRIDRYYMGDAANPDVLFEPMMCQQCGNAPCEMVCPAAATVHSHDGLNQQIYNRCVGTRYCANNCPYKVRRFNWFDNTAKLDPIERLVLNPDVVVRARGVMEKCTFCVQRIQSARIESKRLGERLVAETACQQSCPARAISFGDAKHEDDGIAELQEEPRAFQVLDDIGVRPAVTYLARVRRRGTEEGT